MPSVIEEMAPDVCIVCGKKNPWDRNAGWIYLANAVPMGAVACSGACAAKATERFFATGRCDRAE
jgi:predicted nucleic acid-binding Zn ribbon protein